MKLNAYDERVNALALQYLKEIHLSPAGAEDYANKYIEIYNKIHEVLTSGTGTHF